MSCVVFLGFYFQKLGRIATVLPRDNDVMSSAHLHTKDGGRRNPGVVGTLSSLPYIREIVFDYSCHSHGYHRYPRNDPAHHLRLHTPTTHRGV